MLGNIGGLDKRQKVRMRYDESGQLVEIGKFGDDPAYMPDVERVRRLQEEIQKLQSDNAGLKLQLESVTDQLQRYKTEIDLLKQELIDSDISDNEGAKLKKSR